MSWSDDIVKFHTHLSVFVLHWSSWASFLVAFGVYHKTSKSKYRFGGASSNISRESNRETTQPTTSAHSYRPPSIGEGIPRPVVSQATLDILVKNSISILIRNGC